MTFSTVASLRFIDASLSVCLFVCLSVYLVTKSVSVVFFSLHGYLFCPLSGGHQKAHKNRKHKWKY